MFSRLISTTGGAWSPQPLLTHDRSDLDYFFHSYNIDLDTLLLQSLLLNLPEIQLQGAGPSLPHIEWSSDATTVYRQYPTNQEIEELIRTHMDCLLIMRKDMRVAAVNELMCLHYDKTRLYDSMSDMVMITARGRNQQPAYSKKIKLLGVQSPPQPDLWSIDTIMNATQDWDVEKIIEEGYMHHLGCINSSPYLTQL